MAILICGAMLVYRYNPVESEEYPFAPFGSLFFPSVITQDGILYLFLELGENIRDTIAVQVGVDSAKL